MKLLLVDNDTDTREELYDLCTRCGYDVTIKHCRDVSAAVADEYDVVVLSGGYWYDDAEKHLNTYKNEIELITKTTVPVLGICLGMQLMHVAYNGDVPLLDQPQGGSQKISITELGQLLLGLPPAIEVHKNHTRGVLSVGAQFEVLATSPGHLEIIRHASRPLLGVQFHPEIGDQAFNTALFRALLACINVPLPDAPTSHLRITPAVSVLDDTWYKQLTHVAAVAAEIYTLLGPSADELERARELFFSTAGARNPVLTPSPAVDRTALERTRAQLERLLAQVLQEAHSHIVRDAYESRITELIQNIDMLFAAIAGDATTFATLNTVLYGTPDQGIFVAALDHYHAQAATAQSHPDPAVRDAAAAVADTLPHIKGARPTALAPEQSLFMAMKRQHQAPDGFYAQLFSGAVLPADTMVTTTVGDTLLHRLLHNLGAATYRIIDAPDNVWGVRYQPEGIVRPAAYQLPAEQFLGTVGHEIGSHLLERLNGVDQPLRLLGFGLQGYERGNEGRAVLREQVVYADWRAWTHTLRWHDILRRHLAISLAIGLDRGHPRSFNEVYAIMCPLDVLWECAHGAGEAAQARAQMRTWELLTRVLKGTNGSGGAYYKDIVYLQGNVACWQLAASSPELIMLGDQGKFDVTNPAHRSLLRKLAIL